MSDIRIECVDNGYVVHAEGKEGEGGERSKPARTIETTPGGTAQSVLKHLKRRSGGRTSRGRGVYLSKGKAKKRKAMKDAPAAY